MNAVADGLWFLAAFGVAMLAVTPIFTRDAGAGRPSATLVAQIVLGVLGAAVLGFHMFPIVRKADEDFPVVDTITLGCIAIVGIAAILPRIRSLKIFGDNEIVIDEGKLAVSGYEKSVSSIAHLLERWASTIGTLYANVANAPSVSEVLQIERCFFRDRLGESKEFVAESDRSPVRMAVWLRNESDELEFEFSNEITDDETTGASLGFEQGMIGQCFREQGTLNAADAASLASFVSIAREKVYRAVLVTPITVDGVKLGVLSMDKADATTFTDQAVLVAEAAAALLAACEAFVATRIDELRASGQNETERR